MLSFYPFYIHSIHTTHAQCRHKVLLALMQNEVARGHLQLRAPLLSPTSTARSSAIVGDEQGGGSRERCSASARVHGRRCEGGSCREEGWGESGWVGLGLERAGLPPLVAGAGWRCRKRPVLPCMSIERTQPNSLSVIYRMHGYLCNAKIRDASI